MKTKINEERLKGKKWEIQVDPASPQMESIIFLVIFYIIACLMHKNMKLLAFRAK